MGSGSALDLVHHAADVGGAGFPVVGGHGVVHGVDGLKDLRGHGVIELRIARLNPYEDDIFARLLNLFDQNR